MWIWLFLGVLFVIEFLRGYKSAIRRVAAIKSVESFIYADCTQRGIETTDAERIAWATSAVANYPAK